MFVFLSKKKYILACNFVFKMPACKQWETHTVIIDLRFIDFRFWWCHKVILQTINLVLSCFYLLFLSEKKRDENRCGTAWERGIAILDWTLEAKRRTKDCLVGQYVKLANSCRISKWKGRQCGEDHHWEPTGDVVYTETALLTVEMRASTIQNRGSIASVRHRRQVCVGWKRRSWWETSRKSLIYCRINTHNPVLTLYSVASVLRNSSGGFNGYIYRVFLYP